jgi:23S rRNA U2552 (ribose-2'-O)-methylase RlmE/FtsJ
MTDTNIDSDYLPIVVEIPDPKIDIFDVKLTPLLTDNYDYPRFNLGFHHYIHTNKDKMIILKQFEGKKQVYRVMNKFERSIDNYDTDISSVSKIYFDISPKPNILSLGFFKLWELLFMFKLINSSQDNFISAHIAGDSGSMIQSVMLFRDKFCKKYSNNDKYYTVNLNNNIDDKHISLLDANFIDFYKKQKPAKIVTGSLDNKKADFITADGGYNWDNEITQEQEATQLILGQIVTALNIQKKGGNFVCKMYEMFTMVSTQILCVLKHFYKSVYIVKPLVSHGSNSERYLVCLDFKYSAGDKKAQENIQQLENILDKLRSQKLELTNLSNSFTPSLDLLASVAKANTLITNRQLININNIIAFIESNNYYGDMYQDCREKQIKATNYWVVTFFPDIKNYETQLEKISKETISIIKTNNDKIKLLYEKLII